MDFYADAFVCAIRRWLAKDSIPAQKFVRLLKKGLWGASDKIIRTFSEELERN